MRTPKHVVTGAFGYSGSRIATRLLASGAEVRTLTGKGALAHPLEPLVPREPLAFEDPDALARSLDGARTLTNTYWVRFSEAGFSMERAVERSAVLFEAARRAGVERIVHVSITNPSADSPFAYFRGKAAVEAALVESGVPHTILRPAVLFGGGDILVNNIAWALRHLPVFGLFGRGAYRLQPIHVDDFAELAVRAAFGDPSRPSEVQDAVGPEVFSYRELAEGLRGILGARCAIASMPTGVALASVRLLGRLLGDVTLTREEVGALMADLLVSDGPATGTTRLTTWAADNAAELGRSYHAELDRRTSSPRLAS
ncbi:MAG: NAD(P)H-binding protein [Planctomycetota bacterium]|nr:NAD(P)H-binding protein [Planctomycetota bacterium]